MHAAVRLPTKLTAWHLPQLCHCFQASEPWNYSPGAVPYGCKIPSLNSELLFGTAGPRPLTRESVPMNRPNLLPCVPPVSGCSCGTGVSTKRYVHAFFRTCECSLREELSTPAARFGERSAWLDGSGFDSRLVWKPPVPLKPTGLIDWQPPLQAH